MVEIVDQTKNRSAKRPREEEAKPWRNWKRKSCLNIFLTVEVSSKEFVIWLNFWEILKTTYTTSSLEELGIRRALKFYLTVRPQLSRSDPDGNETISTHTYARCRLLYLRVRIFMHNLMKLEIVLKSYYPVMKGEGSGFKLDCILECQLNIATYDIVGGLTHTPLPKHIQSKKATVNIKNKDEKNSLYCLSYVRKPVVEHAQRPSQYTKDLNNFDISGIKFPVTLNQIAKFEQRNPDFSVNVYKLDKKKEIKLIPLYTTPERKRKYHANLIQIGSSQRPHYVVISNMNRLLFDKTSDRHKMSICEYCLATFSKKPDLDAHKC